MLKELRFVGSGQQHLQLLGAKRGAALLDRLR